MMKQLSQLVLKPFGVKLVRDYPRERMYPDMEPEFFKLYDACAPYTMTTIERMYAVYKSVEYIVKNKIPGDLVECGVWRGGSSMLIASSLKHFGDTSRKVYLYDTFEGMAAPTAADMAHDGDVLKQQWEAQKSGDHNDWCYASLKDVKRNVATIGYPPENITFVVGKVEDTVPGTMPASLALLRLDTDWYESTKHEMVHLYPLLAARGVLLIDDYGRWKGSRDAIDEAFRAMSAFPYLARLDSTGRAYLKP